MNKNITISVVTIVAFLIGGVIGYFISKAYTPEPKEIVKTEIRYEKLPADTIKIYYPEPYKVYDTITNLQTIYVDTAKSIEDYFKVKEYKLDFSNDTLGKFIVETKVHQNSLTYAEAQIEPIIKVVNTEKTVYKTKFFRFYTIIGTSVDFKCNKIQIGVDLADRYLVGASGVRLDNKYGYTIDFGMKF